MSITVAHIIVHLYANVIGQCHGDLSVGQFVVLERSMQQMSKIKDTYVSVVVCKSN